MGARFGEGRSHPRGTRAVGRGVDCRRLEDLLVASPFPGIDPFIEGQLWSDFHSRFIAVLSEALVEKIRPRYVALIEERVYVEREPEQPRVAFRPDVTVAVEARAGSSNLSESAATFPVQVPIHMGDTQVEKYIEIRLRDNREVVAVIELLSPSNKRAHSDGRREYLAKRAMVLHGSVHLVELDLLRGGERLPMAGPLPDGYGYALVSHAGRRPMADVWTVHLRRPLPTIQIPLTGTDPDVGIDLQMVFNLVYERAGYDYAVDYTKALDPPVEASDETWIRALSNA